MPRFQIAETLGLPIEHHVTYNISVVARPGSTAERVQVLDPHAFVSFTV